MIIGTLPLRNVWQSMPGYPPPAAPEGMYDFDKSKELIAYIRDVAPYL